MSDVTQILVAVQRGDPHASEELLPLVYDELRKLAAARMAQEQPGQTLQATSLVHEAYLRLVGGKPEYSWDTCGHFFAAAAEAMRRILVEQARRKARFKRGPKLNRVELDELEITASIPGDDIVELDEALTKLAEKHPQKAELIKLRYFVGLSIDETAMSLGISPATADRHWTYARAWLLRFLSNERAC